MVPTKLPEVEAQPKNKLLASVIVLLIFSMMLNFNLWQKVADQGEAIYNEVIALSAPVAEPDAIAEADPAINQTELACLAKNIYFESANESDLGKIAVAMVVLNRVESQDFPNTICEVVHQPSRNSTNKRGCQFSWTCDGKPDTVRSQEKYQAIVALSRDILRSRDTIVDIVDGALYYHAVYVKPSWAKYFEKVARIDTHIFYKNKDTATP